MAAVMTAGGAVVGQHLRTRLGVADLDVAEQFVLWAVRTRLEGAAKRAHLERGFDLARDDATGGAGHAAFEAWFAVLATHCRRDLYLHRAPCPCLSADERQILGLVASAQAGGEMRLHHLAAALVQPHATGLLRAASRAFAHALCRLGLHLPDRRARRGPGASDRVH